MRYTIYTNILRQLFTDNSLYDVLNYPKYMNDVVPDYPVGYINEHLIPENSIVIRPIKNKIEIIAKSEQVFYSNCVDSNIEELLKDDLQKFFIDDPTSKSFKSLGISKNLIDRLTYHQVVYFYRVFESMYFK